MNKVQSKSSTNKHGDLGNGDRVDGVDLTKGVPSAFASGCNPACFDNAAESVAGESVGVHGVSCSDLVRLGYEQDDMSMNDVHI